MDIHPGLASDGVHTNSTWDIPLCAAGILSSLKSWIVVSVAYLFLRQSFTTGCDYLNNTRAKRGKGEVGQLGAVEVDLILEGIRFPM